MPTGLISTLALLTTRARAETLLPEELEEPEVWPNCSAAILKRTTRARVVRALLEVPEVLVV